jgi:phosphatidylethanolamine/phosphatidyl-N-methylethanolamine N-methyltransferase
MRGEPGMWGAAWRPGRLASVVTTSLAERLQFLRAYARDTTTVGSVTPSSPFLARALVAHVPPSATCVAELGPGTGAVTGELLRRLGPAATILAFETHAPFRDWLRRQYADVRLQILDVPAQEVFDYAAARGHTIQAVVSGLPFGNFPPGVTRAIVASAHAALVPAGTFVGYSYGSRALPAQLRRTFGNCRRERVLLNLPPALVFSARKSAPPVARVRL